MNQGIEPEGAQESLPAEVVRRLEWEIYSKQSPLVQIAQGLTQELFHGLQSHPTASLVPLPLPDSLILV